MPRIGRRSGVPDPTHFRHGAAQAIDAVGDVLDAVLHCAGFPGAYVALAGGHAGDGVGAGFSSGGGKQKSGQSEPARATFDGGGVAREGVLAEVWVAGRCARSADELRARLDGSYSVGSEEYGKEDEGGAVEEALHFGFLSIRMWEGCVSPLLFIGLSLSLSLFLDETLSRDVDRRD